MFVSVVLSFGFHLVQIHLPPSSPFLASHTWKCKSINVSNRIEFLLVLFLMKTVNVFEAVINSCIDAWSYRQISWNFLVFWGEHKKKWQNLKNKNLLVYKYGLMGTKLWRWKMWTLNCIKFKLFYAWLIFLNMFCN